MKSDSCLTAFFIRSVNRSELLQVLWREERGSRLEADFAGFGIGCALTLHCVQGVTRLPRREHRRSRWPCGSIVARLRHGHAKLGACKRHGVLALRPAIHILPQRPAALEHLRVPNMLHLNPRLRRSKLAFLLFDDLREQAANLRLRPVGGQKHRRWVVSVDLLALRSQLKLVIVVET